MQGGLKYLQRHILCTQNERPLCKYRGIWAPAGRGIFKVASACRIGPVRKQRHSFKSGIQEPHHNFLHPDSERDLGPGSRVSPSGPFSFGAQDGFVMAYNVSFQGCAGMINFLF